MANEKSDDNKKTSITPQAQQPDEKGATAQPSGTAAASAPQTPAGTAPAPSTALTGTTDTGLMASATVSAAAQQKQKTLTSDEHASAPVYRVKHGALNLGYELDKDGKSTGNARLLQPGDIVNGLEDSEYQRLLGLGIIEQLK